MESYMQQSVAAQSADIRGAFIMRTYSHVLGAVLTFVALEVVFFRTSLAGSILSVIQGVPWLLVLGAFILVGFLASRAAHTVQSVPMQYLALGAFVLAYAIIFVPMLAIAEMKAPGTIQSAALITLLGFCGLTAVVFVTRKDFSFLRSAIMFGGVLALLLIVGGIAFGFALGTFFSIAMVALASLAVLYDTSNILHHYPEDKHVAAALELFGSIALMFWYVLRLLSSRN